MTQKLQGLFDDSRRAGLSQQTVEVLVENLDGQAGLGCVGAQIDQLNTDEATILAVVIDASGSMSAVRSVVIDSFNQMTRALFDSKARDSILLSAWTFDDQSRLLYGYTPIDAVPDLDDTTYTLGGSTALYDATVDALTGIVAYGQELRNNGIRTRCVVVVITDGEDNASRRTAAQVKTVTSDLLKQEIYTLAFIGMGDPRTFSHIAAEMGFPSVLTIGSTPSEIRRALNMVSGSIIRASTNGAGGGFFTP